VKRGEVMRTVVASIEGEYRRYKMLGEGAIEQLSDEELAQTSGPGGNSMAALVWHIAGNLASRFTDFLDADGEKPWRDRESEFLERKVGHEELREKWEAGWRAVFDSVAGLDDGHLERAVKIRGQSISVCDALHRSLAHTSYHVGQMVFLAKALRGGGWRWLTIPPGGSAAYNQDPKREKPPASANGPRD
jgi:uncharacterized damage-inducible protein DinB